MWMRSGPVTLKLSGPNSVRPPASAVTSSNASTSFCDGRFNAGRNDVERHENFELRLGLVERVVRFGELAIGEAIGCALRGFGPVLLEVEHHLALPGGEAPGLAGGVLALLHLALQLHLILHAAQVAFGLVERIRRRCAARFARRRTPTSRRRRR
jgi:hypothetical protein